MTACNKSAADELCIRCREFFDYVLGHHHLDSFMTKHADNHPWHHNTAETQLCAGRNCYACGYISGTGLRTADPHPGDQQEWPFYFRVFEYLPASGPDAEDRFLIVRIFTKSAYESISWPGLKTDASPPYDALFELRQVKGDRLMASKISSDNTGSEETHAKIKLWMRTCEQHDFCQTWPQLVGTTTQMPLRLLEIKEHHVRLVEGSSLPQGTQYATLSHCWGGKVSLTLRTDNREAFMNDIPWDSLPKTFQDALSTAARLGYVHLWIDALCIMQDHLEDWEEEAANMGHIYANAAINISADDATDSDSGLYRDRNPQAARTLVLKGSSTWLCIHMETAEDIFICKTNLRSWIVQERFLARRVAHFTKHQVHWECACMFSMESLSDGLNLRVNKSTFMKTLHESTRRVLMQRTSSDAIHELWDEVSQMYSSCGLTKVSDRAIAISGVARAVCHFLRCSPSDYSCGVWRQRFVQGIMWSRRDPGVTSEQYRQLGFPSWSWYSAYGGHSAQALSQDRDRPHGTVVLQVASLVSTSASPFAALQMPPIKMRAPLCAARVDCSSEELKRLSLARFHLHIGESQFRTRLPGGSSPYIDLALDGPLEKPHDDLFEMEFFLMLGEMSCFPDAAGVDNVAPEGPPGCNDLLQGAEHLTAECHLLTQCNCLILRPAGLQTFKRIGHLKIDFPRPASGGAVEAQAVDKKRPARCLHAVLKQQFRIPDVPAEHFETVDNTGMYTFLLA